MTKQELKRIMNDPWPEEPVCSKEEFKKILHKAAHSKLFKLEDIEERQCQH